MPNIKSSKKRVRVVETKTARNKVFGSALKTSIKKAKTAIETNDRNKNIIIVNAVSMIDKALSKGILHKNSAARKKSRLLKSSS